MQSPTEQHYFMNCVLTVKIYDVTIIIVIVAVLVVVVIAVVLLPIIIMIATTHSNFILGSPVQAATSHLNVPGLL